MLRTSHHAALTRLAHNRTVTLCIAMKLAADAAGNVRSKTQFAYDEAGTYPIISAGTDSRWADPNTNYRGNVTTTRSWHDIANNLSIETHAQYDNFGNLRKAWDANGNLTQTDYSSTYAYAYPTSVTTPVYETWHNHERNNADYDRSML